MNLKEKSVYVDMDGVMANLEGYYEEKFGKCPPGVDSSADDDFWVNVDTDRNFFYDIKPYEGTKEFFEKVSSMFGRVYILTACPEHDYQNVATLKKLWTIKHLYLSYDGSADHPIFLPVIGSKNKGLFCQSNKDVLIDDSQKCIDSWLRNGGVPIKHVPGDFQSTINELKDLQQKYL